jgi:hypothetical protein
MSIEIILLGKASSSFNVEFAATNMAVVHGGLILFIRM